MGFSGPGRAPYMWAERKNSQEGEKSSQDWNFTSVCTHPSKEHFSNWGHPSFQGVYFQISTTMARIYSALTVTAGNAIQRHREKPVSKTSSFRLLRGTGGAQTTPNSKSNLTFLPFLYSGLQSRGSGAGWGRLQQKNFHNRRNYSY